MAASFAVEEVVPTESAQQADLAFLYEHPQWFAPVFAELEKRGVQFQKFYGPDHFYSVDDGARAPFKVLFNRMSPSADSRGNGSGIFYTLSWLRHLELQGVRVLNGSKAYQFEISKALQHSLLQSLGLRYPKSRVIHQASQAIEAAQGLRFPIVTKANIGGSGKGIQRFDTPEQLARAVEEGSIEFGIDHVALVQEFIPARDGYISRVETVGGKYLYGIRVYLTGQTFDLCPADICQTARGEALENACVLEASKAGLRVEGFTPSDEVIQAIESIVQAAGIDVGGVEYIVDDRDGEIYYYDVNALSNFVADPLRVIGFNPFERLADYLQQEVADAV